jgi:hypothetical protein
MEQKQAQLKLFGEDYSKTTGRIDHEKDISEYQKNDLE